MADPLFQLEIRQETLKSLVRLVDFVLYREYGGVLTIPSGEADDADNKLRRDLMRAMAWIHTDVSEFLED